MKVTVAGWRMAGAILYQIRESRKDRQEEQERDTEEKLERNVGSVQVLRLGFRFALVPRVLACSPLVMMGSLA